MRCYKVPAAKRYNKMKHILITTALLIGLLCTGCIPHNKNTRLSDAELTTLTNRINELKSKMRVTVDDITQERWYLPAVDTSGANEARGESRVVMKVREDGTYLFMSIYVGDKYIDHDQVKFRINDSACATTQVDRLSRRLYKKEYLPGQYIERLSFNKQEDGGVPGKMSRSHGPVTVAFCNTQSNLVTIKLSDKFVQNVKDSYELSQLLAQYAGQKKYMTTTQ